MKARIAMKMLKAKAEYQELSRLDFPYTGSQLMAAAKRAKIPYEWRKRYRSWRKVSKSEGWQEMNELFNQITKTK